MVCFSFCFFFDVYINMWYVFVFLYLFGYVVFIFYSHLTKLLQSSLKWPKLVNRTVLFLTGSVIRRTVKFSLYLFYRLLVMLNIFFVFVYFWCDYFHLDIITNVVVGGITNLTSKRNFQIAWMFPFWKWTCSLH